MPMGTYGGAIGEGDLSGLYRRWLEATAGIKRERLVVSSISPLPELPALGFKHRNFFTRSADRPKGGWDEKSWSPKTRNEIKYALRSGLSLRFARENDEARDCFNLASKKRKNRFYNETFYLKMLERLTPTGRLIWPLAYQGEELAAFQVRFLFKGEFFFWDSAFDIRFSKMRPGYFLFHHLFEAAKKENIRRINFGATPGEAPGVVFFKSRLGGSKVPVHQYSHVSLLKKAARALYEKIRGRK